jgi:hypothetical protein
MTIKKALVVALALIILAILFGNLPIFGRVGIKLVVPGESRNLGRFRTFEACREARRVVLEEDRGVCINSD